MEYRALALRDVAFGTIAAVFATALILLVVFATSARAQSTTAAASQTCAGAQQVQPFDGTQNEMTEPFEVTGKSFRVSVDTQATGGSGSSVTINILNETGQPTGKGFTVSGGESGDELIALGPGIFRLEITATNASYSGAVEDCLGDGSGGGSNGGGSGGVGASQTCAGAQQVQSFNEAQNKMTEPFEVTGKSFRISVDAQAAGAGESKVRIDVLDQTGRPTGKSFTVSGGGSGDELIALGPGIFRLEITATNASYSGTVEDCLGDGKNKGKGGTGGSAAVDCARVQAAAAAQVGGGRFGAVARTSNTKVVTKIVQKLNITQTRVIECIRRIDDQYGSVEAVKAKKIITTTIPDKKKVIASTIPKKKVLAATGGMPIAGAVLLALALVGGGVAILRTAIRRDDQ